MLDKNIHSTLINAMQINARVANLIETKSAKAALKSARAASRTTDFVMTQYG